MVQISHLAKISRPSINKYLTAIRFRIFEYYQDQSPLKCKVEIDESYFGARRVRGERDRSANGKIIVFGLLKQSDKVYTEMVPD